MNRKEKIMSVKDGVFLVFGIMGAFSFGYTVGRQSVWNNIMNVLEGYSESARKEQNKDGNPYMVLNQSDGFIKYYENL